WHPVKSASIDRYRIAVYISSTLQQIGLCRYTQGVAPFIFFMSVCQRAAMGIKRVVICPTVIIFRIVYDCTIAIICICESSVIVGCEIEIVISFEPIVFPNRFNIRHGGSAVQVFILEVNEVLLVYAIQILDSGLVYQ